MSNLSIIKPKNVRIILGKEQFELKFTLRAFAYLEEVFGSVNEAITAFNALEASALIRFLEAGLIHLDSKYNLSQILKNIAPQELFTAMAQVVNEALTADFGFDKDFDWALLYFIARPALHFTEEDFWNSTPKKILEMLKMLGEVKNAKGTNEISTKITSPEDAVRAVMGW